MKLASAIAQRGWVASLAASASAICPAAASLVRKPRPRIAVVRSIHIRSAPSKTASPVSVRRIGTPAPASAAATATSSPARTVEAGRARIAPCGVLNSRSAQNIWLGLISPAGST